MKRYVCSVCGWVYDPDGDMSALDIEPGTPFEDLPEDFACPDCGASKEEFAAEE